MGPWAQMFFKTCFVRGCERQFSEALVFFSTFLLANKCQAVRHIRSQFTLTYLHINLIESSPHLFEVGSKGCNLFSFFFQSLPWADSKTGSQVANDEVNIILDRGRQIKS